MPSIRAVLACLAGVFVFVPDAYAETIQIVGDTALRRASPDTPGNLDRYLHINGGTSVLLAVHVADPSAGPRPKGSRAVLRVTSIPGAFRRGGTIDIVEVTGSWDERTATWNSRPATGRIIASIRVQASQKASALAVDVTPIVNEWFAFPFLNRGLMLRAVGSIDIALRSLESKNSALAAQLLLIPPNSVLVDRHGGDYEDPADAADGAASWCDRAMEAPCTIVVRPGHYPVDRTVVLDGVDLTGSGSLVTELRATPGVSPVVLAVSQSHTTLISNVSIVNRQESGNLGAIGVDGWEPAAGGTQLDLRNVRISVSADGPAHAASAGGLNIFDSGIEVAGSADPTVTGVYGAPFYNEVSEEFEDGYVALTDSSLLVTGGHMATGARGSGVTVVRSHIGVLAETAEEAKGVAVYHRDGGEVFLRHSTVDMRGSGGRQIAVSVTGNFGCRGLIERSELLSDRTTIDSAALHVLNNVGEFACPVNVKDSRLLGGVEFASGGEETILEFDNASLEGDKFIRAAAQAIVRVFNSRVSGTIDFRGDELTCRNVYNEDFTLRASNCQPAAR